jgi:Cytochrome c-type biogenesis protein CcmE
MSFRPQYRFLAGGIIIAVVIVFLLLTSLQTSTAYYLTVEELMAQGPSDRMVRVAGIVVGGTIEWDPQKMFLLFEIADESGSLPVLYEGIRPDMLRDDAQIVVEGRYTASDVFEATTLLLKCPSKYVEE